MINLLSPESKVGLRRLYAMRTLTVGLLVGAALLIAMIAMVLPSFFSLVYAEPEQSALSTDERKAGEKTFARAEEAVRSANAKSKLLLPPADLARSVLPTEALTYLQEALEGAAASTLRHKILIRSVAFAGGSKGKSEKTKSLSTIVVQGIADTRESLRRFVGALEAHPAVFRVDAPVANFLPESSLPFTITLTFR